MLILERWWKSTATFAELIRSENEKIKWLLDVPAFNVEKNYSDEERKFYEKRKNARWNLWNLIPNIAEGYEFDEEIEYQYKTLCYIAAKGIYSEMKRLYETASLIEVFEILMIQKALDW
jgi:hypothetical protein